MSIATPKTKRMMRHRRVRSRVKGTAERPRLAVFRSNKHIYAQLIDDNAGRVIAFSSDAVLKSKKADLQAAKAVGEAVAKEAAAKKITAAVFDRGGYAYHGQVAAVAEGAREAGLTF